MPEEDVKTKEFDVSALKADIIESNKAVMEGLMSGFKDVVLNSVNSTLESHMQNIASAGKGSVTEITDETLAEFKNDIETIGVDEEQGRAMVGMFEKLIKKATTALRKELLSDVDGVIDTKDKNKTTVQNTMRMFPDIKNKSSELFRMAKTMLDELSPHARSAPDAESIAVEKAALRLGIQPRTLKDISAFDAQNPTGGDDTAKKGKKEISADVAKLFNVDPKAVNEQMKLKGYFQ